tara:strand:- start:3034 stop:3303 length:270 start_codon:yes stop_codon:yes gene_type:complete
MTYSIDDIKKGDMLWVELKGPDQNYGHGEVIETWKDEETGYEYFEFHCLVNGGQRCGRIDLIIKKPNARMISKYLQSRKEFNEAMKERK